MESKAKRLDCPSSHFTAQLRNITMRKVSQTAKFETASMQKKKKRKTACGAFSLGLTAASARNVLWKQVCQINSDSVSIQLTQLTNELLPLLVSVAFSAWPTESISWSPLAYLEFVSYRLKECVHLNSKFTEVVKVKLHFVQRHKFLTTEKSPPVLFLCCFIVPMLSTSDETTSRAPSLQPVAAFPSNGSLLLIFIWNIGNRKLKKKICKQCRGRLWICIFLFPFSTSVLLFAPSSLLSCSVSLCFHPVAVFFHVCLLIVALLRRLPPWANDDGKYFARHNRAKMQNVVN